MKKKIKISTPKNNKVKITFSTSDYYMQFFKFLSSNLRLLKFSNVVLGFKIKIKILHVEKLIKHDNAINSRSLRCYAPIFQSLGWSLAVGANY